MSSPRFTENLNKWSYRAIKCAVDGMALIIKGLALKIRI